MAKLTKWLKRTQNTNRKFRSIRITLKCLPVFWRTVASWFISWLRSDQIWRCERCLSSIREHHVLLQPSGMKEESAHVLFVSKRASHLQNPAESVDESAARGKRAVSRSLKLCIVWSLCSGSRQILYIDPSNFSLSHFLACGWVWTRSSGKCRSILER